MDIIHVSDDMAIEKLRAYAATEMFSGQIAGINSNYYEFIEGEFPTMRIAEWLPDKNYHQNRKVLDLVCTSKTAWHIQKIGQHYHVGYGIETTTDLDELRACFRLAVKFHMKIASSELTT